MERTWKDKETIEVEWENDILIVRTWSHFHNGKQGNSFRLERAAAECLFSMLSEALEKEGDEK